MEATVNKDVLDAIPNIDERAERQELAAVELRLEREKGIPRTRIREILPDMLRDGAVSESDPLIARWLYLQTTVGADRD